MPNDPTTDISPPEKADVAVAEAVAPYRDTLPVRALSFFGKLGDQPPMFTISGVVLGAGLLTGNKRLARAGLRMVAANSVATLAKNFVKHRINRTRPELLTYEGRYEMHPGNSEDHDETSFPSGHSAGAVATARAFIREYPKYGVPAHSAASLIALSQIPRGAHYPTDVGAGSAIGLLAEWAVSKVMDFSGGTKRK
ncbi:MAG: phosphatase PAP2 family protein [Verrucomicrobiaceae bacterium]|nr:MAG: phosphatase PAP2 family protein [Verrucomicrobiaceae bacterium]